MGLRFHKTLKLLPGIRLNLSKTGASLSVGGKGLTCNIGKKGTKTTIGMPGTGVSYSSYLPYRNTEKSANRNRSAIVIWVVITVLAAALALLLHYGKATT